MRSILVPTIALAMAFTGATFASLPAKAAQPGSTAVKPSSVQQDNITTINKLRTDLQNAGFTDVQVVADAFVVQAKDKDGNPVVMTLSPSGVVAYKTITTGGDHAGSTGSGDSAARSGSSTKSQ